MTVQEIVNEICISEGYVHTILRDDLTCTEWEWNLCLSYFHVSRKSFSLMSYRICDEVCQWWLWLPEDCDHWRWAVGVQVWPRNWGLGRYNWSLQHPRDQRKNDRWESQSRVMLTVFYDYFRVVHHEYAQEAQNVNKRYCQEVLHFSSAVKVRDLDSCTSGSYIMTMPLPCLHIWSRIFVQAENFSCLPDFFVMALCDFRLFSKVEMPVNKSSLSCWLCQWSLDGAKGA